MKASLERARDKNKKDQGTRPQKPAEGFSIHDRPPGHLASSKDIRRMKNSDSPKAVQQALT
jgi:hypothetical protein